MQRCSVISSLRDILNEFAHCLKRKDKGYNLEPYQFLPDAMKTVPDVQPLFITVDPFRDTKELIKDYLKEFHPKMLGFTGSTEKIAEACRAYRVYFSAGPRDDDDDYIVSVIPVLQKFRL